MEITCFRGAIAVQPDYVEAQNQWGNVLQGLGRSEEEIAACQEILAINPNMTAAYLSI